MKFDLIFQEEIDDIEFEIHKCQEKSHIQQVAYSTYHFCLTQVCFTCMKIRTSMKPQDFTEVVKSVPNKEDKNEE